MAQYLHNGNEYLESMLGSLKARVASLNVNYRYVEGELNYLFDNADVVAVVFERSYAPLLAAYLHRYTRLTWHDEAAARAFLDVMNLQRPPTALLSPRLLCRTLLGSRHPPPATTPTPGVAGAAP